MSKRSPYEFAEDRSGQKYWRSLAELEQKPELLAKLPAEFPPNITEPPDGISRRDFFNLMGASAALAGLAACRSPDEKIVPYALAPEEQIPGAPMYYATATSFGGTAIGLIVEAHDGRPTKLEGNPAHPDSVGGGLAPWVQAAVLDLYDPDRTASPLQKEGGKLVERTWAQAADALKAMGGKLKAQQGQRFAVLTAGHRSPTLQAQLDELKKAMPVARVVRWEPAGREAQQNGSRIAFGKAFETVLDVGKAKVIVTLDADILGTDGSVVKQSAGYAAGRKLDAEMNRLYALESTFTVTGSSADHRLRLQSREVSAFAFALAAEIGAGGVALNEIAGAGAARAGQLNDRAKTWAKAVAKDLLARRGQGLVVAGPRQPPVVHAVAHALNAALGNVGTTVKYVKLFDETGEGANNLQALASALESGAIDTLLVLNTNPAFTAPADTNFDEVLKQAAQKGATVITVAAGLDETSEHATWHLNRSHDLESWGDVVAEDGTASIVQPLIAPLYDSRSDAEVISLLLGKGERGYDLVRATWMPKLALGGEKAWRKALHEGVLADVEGFPFAAESPVVQSAAIAQAAQRLPAGGGIEVTFSPDPHAWDGRTANNPWLQEWPDPMHKLCWGNVGLVSPDTAKKLGVSDGQMLYFTTAQGQSAHVPALVAIGQAEDSIALTFGQGRRKAGRVGAGVGHDVYALRTTDALGYQTDVKVAALGGDAKLAQTQEHFALEGRPHVRATSLEEYLASPGKVAQQGPKGTQLFNLWSDQKTDLIHKWGMAIDLNSCTGCGACMVACQAENNIPVVGADGVRRSREMNWLRVDRYFEGSPEEPRSVAQPMPCQQCENAPCEQVCPVAATTHSPEGLNDMAYNRCVGTRYCANNCPFKVRKFNFFNYTKETPTLHQMQYNPDVTVRSRGVMEKCTFCVQRINEAKIEFKRQGTNKIPDGHIITACQQACPVGAITFGDLNDKDSAVAKAHREPRSYVLLEEINVRPRVAYLAKIRNLNSELEKA